MRLLHLPSLQGSPRLLTVKNSSLNFHPGLSFVTLSSVSMFELDEYYHTPNVQVNLMCCIGLGVFL